VSTRSLRPDLPVLLQAAVSAIGGATRPGQEQMAVAVFEAAETGRHLLVQAGTGTGKSLAYLVPAIERAVAGKGPVVISTATLALQAQIVDRDLPRVAAALAPVLGRFPTWQLVKGRANYLCTHRLQRALRDSKSLFVALSRSNCSASPSGRGALRTARCPTWRSNLIPRYGMRFAPNAASARQGSARKRVELVSSNRLGV